jgi:hypothetical protein
MFMSMFKFLNFLISLILAGLRHVPFFYLTGGLVRRATPYGPPALGMAEFSAKAIFSAFDFLVHYFQPIEYFISLSRS